MAVTDRRARERAAQRQLITSTARKLAEAQGWQAVTTRRLSTEIEYSQPVLYKHFSSMERIVESVAIEGFGELAETLSGIRSTTRNKKQALRRVAHTFIQFAHDNPALFDAMFIRTTTLKFASPDTPPELTAAFAELRVAVAAVAGARDANTLAEVLWAALHGLVTLDRNGRLRPDRQRERVDLLIEQLATAPRRRR